MSRGKNQIQGKIEVFTVICDYLELYENEIGGYDYYCMVIDAVADPNECIICPYLLDKDKFESHQLKRLNEGQDYFEEF